MKSVVNRCRTCYNAIKGLRLLTNLAKCGGKPDQKSYAELIIEVTNINIMKDCKELPQFICNGCSRKLKVAHAFIQQTHAVNEQFMEMLAGQAESDKHSDCLEEAQVDIQSCLEIKMEPHTITDNDTNIELKTEETAELLQSSLLDMDVLSGKSVEKVEIIEHALKKKDNNIKNISSKDTFKRNLAKDTKIKSNSRFSQSESNDSDNDGLDNDQVSEIELQRDIEDDTQNYKKEDEKKLGKCRKSQEVLVMPCEDDDVAVPCSQCNKIFSNSKALMRHQRTSHIPEDQKCTCPLCYRKFSRSCNMYTHMRTFHGPETVPLIRKPLTQERIFQCEKCPRNYTKKKYLNIHIKNKHSQENESSEKDNDNSKQDINIPDVETPPKSNKPKRYEVSSLCSICGSSFSSKTHLIVHMRRHTGERPFKCDLCDRAYPRISELTCHRRIHTGEKPFACKICGKTFRVSSKMTTHMRSHTDIRPYKCSQCERSFKHSKDLSIHFRIHTGERPYTCIVCSSTFTQSNTLKAHRIKLGHMDNSLENMNNLP